MRASAGLATQAALADFASLSAFEPHRLHTTEMAVEGGWCSGRQTVRTEHCEVVVGSPQSAVLPASDREGQAEHYERSDGRSTVRRDRSEEISSAQQGSLDSTR